jgi:hypothetical protein
MAVTGIGCGAALIDSIDNLSSLEKEVLKLRYGAVHGQADRDACAAEWRDTCLYAIGFTGSVLVSLSAALSLSSYFSPTATSAIATVVLVASLASNAAQSFRERQHLKDTAISARRLANKVERRLFLFLSGTDPYVLAEDGSRAAAFRAFVADIETLKLQSDEDRLFLREHADAALTGIGAAVPSTAAGTAAGTARPPTLPMAPSAVSRTGPALLARVEPV